MRACPLEETSTGSTTRFSSSPAAASSATAATVAGVASMPVFTASGGRSTRTASIWSTTKEGSMATTPRTAEVCCAVTAVTAQQPCTPWAAKVRRSACRPAPPPESEPAMVRAILGVTAEDYRSALTVPSGVELEHLGHPVLDAPAQDVEVDRGVVVTRDSEGDLAVVG